MKKNFPKESKQSLGKFPCLLDDCDSTDGMHVWDSDRIGLNAFCFSCRRNIPQPLVRSLFESGENIANISQAVINSESNKALSGHNNNGETMVTYTEKAAFGDPENNQPFISSKSNKMANQGSPNISLQELSSHPIRSISDRNLSMQTCEHYGVRVGVSTTDGTTPVYHLYPYFNEDNVLCGYKEKTCKTKDFRVHGNVKSTHLFGKNVIPLKGKKIWITEGELDALACYQVLKEDSSINWSPAVVSLPQGSNSVVNCISENMDVFDGYDEVIIVFDSDAPGIEARKAACKLLAGKVSYVDLPEKDANDMLMKGKGTDLKWALLTKNKVYQPDDIINLKDGYERYKEKKAARVHYTYPPCLEGLNEKIYGPYLGSIVTITSGTGCGKTQVLREIMYHLNQTTDLPQAGMFLEESYEDTIQGQLALHTNKRITLPGVELSDEEEFEAYQEIFGNGKTFIYDFFGGMDDDSLLSKLRYFALSGCKVIYLDHLSIVVSEFAAQGDERQRIDALMTKLAKFAKEYGIILFLVVHLRKTDNSKKSFEQGEVPSLDDLRGSGAIKQLSWEVIAVSRNQQHTNPETAKVCKVTVLKSRVDGSATGTAGFYKFNEDTGRLNHCTEPFDFDQRKNNKVTEF